MINTIGAMCYKCKNETICLSNNIYIYIYIYILFDYTQKLLFLPILDWIGELNDMIESKFKWLNPIIKWGNITSPVQFISNCIA